MHGYGAWVASVSEAGVGVDVAVLDVGSVSHGHSFLAILLLRLAATAAIHARVDDATNAHLDGEGLEDVYCHLLAAIHARVDDAVRC